MPFDWTFPTQNRSRPLRGLATPVPDLRDALQDLKPANWAAPRLPRISPLTQLDHIPSNIDGLARSSPKWNLGNAFNEMVSATVKS